MREKIVTFLSLTGIDKYPDAMANGYAEQIRAQFPSDQSSEKAFELVDKALDENKSALFDTMVSAYADAFTETEMDQLIAFYEAPLGQRIVELGGIVLPALLEAGETWGHDVVKSIEGDLNKLLS